MIKPLFNQCLIELVDDYAGVVRSTADERVQKGYLRDYQIIEQHLTTSTGHKIDKLEVYYQELKALVGQLVYYQEYADSGAVFEQDGKKWALVPWYRLIGFEGISEGKEDGK